MQLKKSESTGKKLYTGFFLGKVLAVNPTKEELADLIGYDLNPDQEDIKYEGKTDKGDDYVAMSFWMQADTPQKQWFNARFRIVNKPLISDKSGKTQWVNQTAGSTWVDKQENLPDWFTHFQNKNKENVADKHVREAMQGEANLYTFLRAWLNGVSFFDVDTNVLVDTERMFRNIDKYVRDEYQPLIDAQIELDKETDRDKHAALAKNMLTKPVLALACVYTKDTDEGPKQYQNLYAEFLGGYLQKKVNLAISSNNWMGDDKMKKYYEQVKGEHGCKDAYTLTMLQDFNADDHQQAGAENFIAEGGASAAKPGEEISY